METVLLYHVAYQEIQKPDIRFGRRISGRASIYLPTENLQANGQKNDGRTT